MIAKTNELTTKLDTGRKSSSSKQKARPKARQVKTDRSLPPQIDKSPSAGRSTKASRLIELLSSKAGASIKDMMTATGWQQHSVRGFLAGTVKRRFGLNLTSSVIGHDPRRYRVVTRRDR